MRKLVSCLIIVLLTACAQTVPLRQEETLPQEIELTKEVRRIASAPAAAPAFKYSPPSMVSPRYESMTAESASRNTVTSDSNTRYIVSRDFFYRINKIDYDRFNFIYLPRKPVTTDEKRKYIKICELWKGSFNFTKEVKEIIKDKTGTSIIPLYWPLRNPVKNDSCDSLIEEYDYVRISNIVSDYKKFETNSIQVVTLLKNNLITMNIGRLINENELASAFDIWKDRMTRFPNSIENINPYSLLDSLREVLGSLSGLLSIKKLS